RRAGAGLRGSDRPLGQVRPTWDDNAICFHLEPSGGEPIVSDVFSRTEGGGGPPVLTRDAQTILDVRGRYQAALRDATRAEVGWIRVRIGPYEPAPRIYEAKLPPGVSEEFAVAAVISLASEIDWIEGHTQNVSLKAKGPLIQSIPLHCPAGRDPGCAAPSIRQHPGRWRRAESANPSEMASAAATRHSPPDVEDVVLDPIDLGIEGEHHAGLRCR